MYIHYLFHIHIIYSSKFSSIARLGLIKVCRIITTYTHTISLILIHIFNHFIYEETIFLNIIAFYLFLTYLYFITLFLVLYLKLRCLN